MFYIPRLSIFFSYLFSDLLPMDTYFYGRPSRLYIDYD